MSDIAESILRKIIHCGWFDLDVDPGHVTIDGDCELTDEEAAYLRSLEESEAGGSDRER